MAGPVHVLDDYYLGLTALITIGYQLFFFAIAYYFKFDKVTGKLALLAGRIPLLTGLAWPDLAGGTNFVVLAIVTLALGGAQNARQVVVSVFVVVWGLRIAGFLFFRVMKTGKDDRFDQMRSNFTAFLGFWILQMAWVWVVSLPVIVLNSPAVQLYSQHSFGTARDVAGIVLFVVGLVVESVSDMQRYLFRSHNDKSSILNTGLFSVSRHPNYFGEIILHFGKLAILICV